MGVPRLGFVWMVAWPDFRARIRRFLVIGVGMALVLAITLLLSGFSEGFNLRANRLLDVFGGSHYVVVDGAAGPMSSTSPFPVSATTEAIAAAGVSATPLLLTPNAVLIDGQPVSVMTVATPDGVSWPRITSGRAVSGPGEAVVDDEITELDVGDEFVLGGEPMVVVGTTSEVTWDIVTAGVFVSRQQALDLFAGGEDVATAIVLDAPVAQPGPGLELQARADGFDDLLARADAAKSSIDAFRLTLWALAVVIVGAVLYLAAVERVADFAIFKATGASDGDLVLGLALQAALLGLIAGVLSIGLAHVMAPLYPGLLSFPVRVVWPVIPVAVVIAVLASLVGIRRAIRVDPSQAFG